MTSVLSSTAMNGYRVKVNRWCAMSPASRSAFSASWYSIQRQRHVFDDVVDRGFRHAVGSQLVARKPNLMLVGAALDDAVAEP